MVLGAAGASAPLSGSTGLATGVLQCACGSHGACLPSAPTESNMRIPRDKGMCAWFVALWHVKSALFTGQGGSRGRGLHCSHTVQIEPTQGLYLQTEKPPLHLVGLFSALGSQDQPHHTPLWTSLDNLRGKFAPWVSRVHAGVEWLGGSGYSR